MAENAQDTAGNQENNPVIHTQKVYIKDISFETPNSPEIFTREWKPNLNLDLGQKITELQDDHYEVVLSLTATMKVDDATAYLAEVQQAGIFLVKGLDTEQMHRILNVHCPRMLYPYASFVISDLVTRSGFPQLLLAPVNFEALYKNRQAESAAARQPAGN
ncbi:MAG: protein-export chaperone SecB [Gammaproteobacteria bacterium]